MRRIAIVGAGQAGLLAAHDLLRQGYEVTLFSDKTPEDFLERARPTGTAARFDVALSYERDLGLDYWRDKAPHIDGIHLHFSTAKNPHNALLTLLGRLSRPAMAIDLRLQSATWMRAFAERGGKTEIGNVDLGQLDEIAADNDLVVVAAGRGEIHRLFPRDQGRSTWVRPQRNLTMVNVTGVGMQMPYAPHLTPVKFNFFARYGEMFWVPWYSKDGAPSWSLVFEARPGGPMDVFQGSGSADEALERGKSVINRFAPWDAEWVRDAVPCDANSWLVGSFTPEVRQVVGTLPSGRHVMALGDTAHSLDPISGQGANNGNKMARNLVASIVERQDRALDAAWMRDTAEDFWERNRWTEEFNNTLIRPLTKPGQSLLLAQYGSTGSVGDTSPQQILANRFCDNFNDPADLTPAFHQDEISRRVIAQHFGEADKPVRQGKTRIVRAQLRQAFGRPANHPGTSPLKGSA
ncbi:styrene monooxygenase/indole monooxygenase family protein [Kribbella sp. NPDC051620]|uniref:styrene monooxygenase/indole monooxygenase family protein n=1 Tax=Kribbella sp. NPDC051620 TaxID=3364120 RepID=UPI003788EDE2